MSRTITAKVLMMCCAAALIAALAACSDKGHDHEKMKNERSFASQ